MKRWGIALSTTCTIALVAALVPAAASGVNVEAPTASSFSVDERKKPKPTKKPKPSNSPKPSKSPKPSPTPSVGAPVPVQAKMVGEWIDRQWATLEEGTPRFTYFVEPVLQGSHWEAALIAGAEEAFAIHSAVGYPINRDFRVYMGWNRQWLLDNLPENACSGGNWSTVAQCWGTDVILANFYAYVEGNPDYTPQSYPRPYNRIHMAGHLGHELTHMVQEEISPRHRERMQYADSYWLVEGWAMMVELMTAAKVYNLPYTKIRDHKLQAMGWRCVDVDLKDLLYKKSPEACEYLNGMLAMEYLIWKTEDKAAGLTYILQDTDTPQEAFQRAFSLDLDAFMEEADEYVKKEIRLYWLRQPFED